MNTSRHSVHNTSPHLLNALRTLFDSLDRKHGSQGYIRFQELVDDFSYEASHRDLWLLLPNGFLDCLKKVMPFNGMLTYERLCAGLRLATRTAIGDYQDHVMYANGHAFVKNGSTPYNMAPSTNPVVRAQQRQSVHNSLSTGSSRNSSPLNPPMAPVRGQDSVEKMRRMENVHVANNNYLARNASPTSFRVVEAANGNGYSDSGFPQWSNECDQSGFRSNSPTPNSLYTKNNANGMINGKRSKPLNNGASRYHNNHHSQQQQQPPPYNQALSLSKIDLNKVEVPENGLKYQNGRTYFAKSTPHLNGNAHHNGHHQPSVVANGNGVARVSPIGQQFVSERAEIAHSRPVIGQSVNESESDHVVKLRHKKAFAPPISENRRHTLSEGGSDQNMLKHTRVLQEERELLTKGQETTTRLQDWYSDRLSKLDTRHKLLGKSMIPLEFAVHEEKLNYLRAHVTELNRRMVALMESSEKGFPSYINVEVSRSIPQPTDDQVMWLKRQNKMLTDEVTEKTQRIALLEVEKSSIVKRMYENSTNKSQISPNNETVYSLPVKNNNRHVQLIKPNVEEPNNRYNTLM